MLFRLEEGESLVTYYMLPLVGVNKKSFGRHFKSSYIDKQGLKIYVELKSNMTSPLYKTNRNYITEIIINNVKFIQFVLPTEFIADGKLFTLGLYSQFSKNAKKLIYKTSTLPYNATMGSFSVSHPVLQALDKTKTLRTFLINKVGAVLADNGELMQEPKEWWFIENKI